MKLKVVDWVTYDDDYPDGKLCWAARNAIIDNIKEHGYVFSGWAHQEGYRCAPLLNDGKVYRYSQRGWGDVMAEANGYMGPYDYSLFAFTLDSSDEIRPKGRRQGKIVPESELYERFEREVSPEIFEQAREAHEILLEDYEELRYLNEGDALALVSGDSRAEYKVTEAYRKRAKGTSDEDEKFALCVSLSAL